MFATSRRRSRKVCSTTAMSSSLTKKKTKKQQFPESTPNPSLPYDLLLSCLARVSRLYYPTLSLVSKSCRTLVASPEIYKTRSLLNRTESCLYVCLQFPADPNQRWFTLCGKPNHMPEKKKKKSSGYVLAPVTIPNSPPVSREGMVTVGSNIYAIGGSTRNESSSSVSVLDCRSHTWHEAPNMRMERELPAASLVDGKIYVAGGFRGFNASNWMEVFDIKTQSWELVVTTLAERYSHHVYMSRVIQGKIYLFGYNAVAYKPREDQWIAINRIRERSFDFDGCVIDNVMYSWCDSRGIRWYDSEVRDWTKLKGLEGLPKFASYSTVRLEGCGGKLVVLWDKYLPASGYKEKMIWCAEISLEMGKDEEISGTVEWFDAVLTVPKSYKFVCPISATV